MEMGRERWKNEIINTENSKYEHSSFMLDIPISSPPPTISQYYGVIRTLCF
jgi:hypothetical protein